MGCGSDSKPSTGPDDEGPDIDPANFVQGITNPYLPLSPGTTFVYEGQSGDETERVVVEVTAQTKVILGVTCVVVRDRVWIDGELEEDTNDWYAQHENGDIWYFGEDSKEIQGGQVVSTEGSWEAGVDGAEPGILIQADPEVGESYQQEYYEGEAEDMAEVVSLDASVSVPAGSYDGCLQTKEWNPLEPGVSEHKYYAPGVGLVKEEAAEGGQGYLELVEILHR
jgi:hypothetical protein